MPVFKYTAYRADGGSESGTIEADGPRDAGALLKARGLHPKDIAPDAPARRAFRLPGQSPADRLPSITRQLALLIRSGTPLVDALRALSDEAASGPVRAVIVDVRERVTAGASLSRALDAHPDVFPEYYRHMVAAGQESGELDRVLDRVAAYIESQAEVREKVRTAMVYPIIMASVAALVLVMLFTFVVPKIVRIFDDSRAALPLATVILIKVNRLITHWWWAMAGALAALLIAWKRMLTERRESIDRLLMRPLGSLYLARFTRTLGFLMEGGMPVTRALALAGRASGNSWLGRHAEHGAERVTEGIGLAESMPSLPPVLTELIATGQRGGRLPEILAHAADSYEREFGRIVERGLAVLGPVLVLVMAVIVGFIVFAVLLPMFQLNQMVG